MMRHLFIITLLGAILALVSCDDLIEKNLKNQTVNVLSPPNGATLASSVVSFWWDSLAGATKYDVQIVSPSFSNIQFLIMDSTVIGNKLYYTFTPGNYQWRIKALNNSSSTNFSTYSFTIDSTLSLSGQTLLLLNPTNNYATNNLAVNFQWASIFSATNYHFIILASNGNTVYENSNLQGTSTSYTLPSADTYTWKVRAENTSSVTLYSQNTLVVDNTAPAIPTSLSPADGTTLTNPFTLSWTQATDAGSFIYDSLYISSDINQDTLLRAVRPGTASYSDTLISGSYYWRLRAVDAAGNYSGYTSTYKFIIQ